MLKFMQKIPAGLLLIPMLIAALINTFTPTLFSQFGGLSEAFLTNKGVGYIVGLVCFCSATLLDIKTIKSVLKIQGTLLLTKIILCIILGLIFFKLFGLSGCLGISLIGFIGCISSLNPSLYLALVSDYGQQQDKAAFGLTGLLCVPAFPLFLYSLVQGGNMDWQPIVSTLIPILLGVLIGNLDKDMAKLFSSGLMLLTPLMGWAFGTGINLIDAFKAGPQGLLLTIIFYIFMLPALYLVETLWLKQSGISTLGIASVAGMTVAFPRIIAAAKPELLDLANVATAQIAFAVVLTSVITPYITQKIVKYKKIANNN